MPRAVLLPNVTEFPSRSMQRYAAGLEHSLRQLDDGWTLDVLRCDAWRPAARLLPAPLGDRVAERIARWVVYPRMAARSRGDAFHVLDQSHSHLVLSLPRGRAVLTCHDLIPYLAARGELSLPLTREVRASLQRRAAGIRAAARIVTLTRAVRDDLVRLLGIPEERIRVIPLGVDAAFRPGNRPEDAVWLEERLPGVRGRRRLLQVATGGAYKNTSALLAALAEIQRVVPDVCLVRVGAPLSAEETDQVRLLKLSAHIHQLSGITDEELARCYRGCCLLAHPSLTEGFGWPLLEAMACGLPVVAGRGGGQVEVVAEAGLLVDPRRPEELAAALLRLLREPGLGAALAEAGKRRAKAMTWEQCARATRAVYLEVAEESEP